MDALSEMLASYVPALITRRLALEPAPPSAPVTTQPADGLSPACVMGAEPLSAAARSLCARMTGTG